VTHYCEACGQEMVCLKCNPPAKRKLNVQAQAVKDCLDFYVACRLAIGQPYPGTPPPGAVIKWLGTQPIREGAVKLFGQCCELAVKAAKHDKQFHPFPMTVPAFCAAIPKLNGAWLDGAKANAAKPQRADPQQQALLERARRCTNSGDGCPGVDPKNPVCLVCSRGVAGSKR
jgi:hypothetical protein